jgi:hypothetical protein
LLQGSLMRLVSLWWELPPRLDSNTNILRGGMQQFFVGDLKFSLPLLIKQMFIFTFQ